MYRNLNQQAALLPDASIALSQTYDSIAQITLQLAERSLPVRSLAGRDRQLLRTPMGNPR